MSSRPFASTNVRLTASIPLDVDFGLPLRRLVYFLLGSYVALASADWLAAPGRLTDIGSLRRLTSMSGEQSMAYWVDTTQTLMIALTSWLLYAVVRRLPAGSARMWCVLATFFSLKTIYSGALVHGRVRDVSEALRDGFLYGFGIGEWFAQPTGVLDLERWEVAGWLVLVGLAGWIGRFLWRELSGLRVVLMGAVSCLVASVLLDWVEIEGSYEWIADLSKDSAAFLALVGGTLLWYCLMRVLGRSTSELTLRFEQE